MVINMEYPMSLTEYYDDYEDCVTSQTLKWAHDGFVGRFHVHDMWDCPEDCTISRDLFSAWDFVEAVRFGMSLAAKGYDSIELKKERIGPEDEDEE